MKVLVDSSVWIDYFRGTGSADVVEPLIGENLVVTNDLILAELLPPLQLRRQRRLIGLLRTIARQPMRIDWEEIVQMQVTCLRQGISRVGIPDLIIAQHARRHGLELLTLDRHFVLMSRHLPLVLHG